MVNNNLCKVEIDPNSPLKEYTARYTNGMSKDIQAHNIDEAWSIAFKEPYEVLDVIGGK